MGSSLLGCADKEVHEDGTDIRSWHFSEVSPAANEGCS